MTSSNWIIAKIKQVRGKLLAVAKIRAAGGEVVENIHISSIEELAAMKDGVDFDALSCWYFCVTTPRGHALTANLYR